MNGHPSHDRLPAGALALIAAYPRTVSSGWRFLLISGSTRAGSTNAAALRTLQQVAPPRVETSLYSGLTQLPAFVPDDEAPAPDAVAALRRELAAADAVIFCTPEYAGSVPGSLKNLLDWTVGSGELYGRPVAWINVAAAGRGAGADATMATVLGYVGAEIISRACVRVSVPRDGVGQDGLVHAAQQRAELAEVLTTIVEHLDRRTSAGPHP